jgi:hypothetical protein
MKTNKMVLFGMVLALVLSACAGFTIQVNPVGGAVPPTANAQQLAALSTPVPPTQPAPRAVQSVDFGNMLAQNNFRLMPYKDGACSNPCSRYTNLTLGMNSIVYTNGDISLALILTSDYDTHEQAIVLGALLRAGFGSETADWVFNNMSSNDFTQRATIGNYHVAMKTDSSDPSLPVLIIIFQPVGASGDNG